ncbi:MAG: M14 family metallopeptidase [bacterium]
MTQRPSVLVLTALLIAADPGGAGAQEIVPTGDLPLTVAEASGYTRTATYGDVLAWIDRLQALGAEMHVTTMGATTEGREIPLVILSRPLVASPREAHRSGKPIIYLQGNIHAGEVEGKDALLMLIRDLTLGDARELLDRVVLLIDPIYNADGNEKWAPVERNRRGQDGPEEVGIRYNGMGLDLNRDCMKAESPEMRGSLEHVVNVWQPDLFMDLHTTNGSYHGYDLTYAPGLTPIGPGGPTRFAFQEMLPEISRRLDARGHKLFHYGNFSGGYPPTRWATFGWHPRYASNYMGMRGMISILSEAVSYRPFRTRLSATYWFVREIVDYAGRHGSRIRSITDAARQQAVQWGQEPSSAPEQGVRFEYASSGRVTALFEVMDPPPGEESRRGTRTGRIEETRVELLNRFRSAETRPYPAGYIVPAAYPEAVRNLLGHGITVEVLEGAWTGETQIFRADSLAVAPRAYQGHRMISVWGDYRSEERTVPAGWYFVPAAQPLGPLAFALLEPEVEDSLYAWNFFDRGLYEGRDAPVLRVMRVPFVSRSLVEERGKGSEGPGNRP